MQARLRHFWAYTVPNLALAAVNLTPYRVWHNATRRGWLDSGHGVVEGTDVMTRREFHSVIRDRIALALDGRSVRWLARRTGIPNSTLAWQMKKPRFDVESLFKIAAALQREVGDFLPE